MVIMRTLVFIFLALLLLLAGPVAQAQSMSLSGKYGCVFREDLSGLESQLNGMPSIGSIYLLHVNFDTLRADVNATLISIYNSPSARSESVTLKDTSVSVKPGPITASWTVTLGASDGRVENPLTAHVIAVNGGQTLMAVSDVSQREIYPSAGICNRL